jgi:uncharacterized membrane protein
MSTGALAVSAAGAARVTVADFASGLAASASPVLVLGGELHLPPLFELVLSLLLLLLHAAVVKLTIRRATQDSRREPRDIILPFADETVGAGESHSGGAGRSRVTSGGAVD